VTGRRQLVHWVFVLLLPVIVAWLGVSVAGAIGLVLVVLVWRWMISLSGLIAPEKGPVLQLDSISASHFVEKIRWCMDRLGLDYTEAQSAGAVGVWFTGRTVPRLRIRTGAVQSSIANSPEILRYLWGHYAVDHDAAFLEPVAERIELEQAFDRYGRNLQVWVYYHVAQDKDLLLHVWGVNSPLVPAWQRVVVRVARPLLVFLIRKSFRITQENYERAVERIETLLSDIDTRLADGRTSILGEERINYTDITFAALTGVWLMPKNYGAGKADAVRFEHEQLPARMKADIARWREDYPRATTYVLDLYANERGQQT